MPPAAIPSETGVALRVVLTPDAFGRALVDAEVAGLLGLWREDRIRPVVNRSLLLRYFRLLGALGLDERQIRRWGWWFTSRNRSFYLDEPTSEARTLPAICIELALHHAPCWVVHSGLIVSPPEPKSWLTLREFLTRFDRLKATKSPGPRQRAQGVPGFE